MMRTIIFLTLKDLTEIDDELVCLEGTNALRTSLLMSKKKFHTDSGLLTDILIDKNRRIQVHDLRNKLHKYHIFTNATQQTDLPDCNHIIPNSKTCRSRTHATLELWEFLGPFFEH